MSFAAALFNGVTAAGRWAFSPGKRKWTLALLGAALVAILIYRVQSYRAARDEAVAASAVAQETVETVQRANVSADRAVTGAIIAKSQISQKEAPGLARTKAALDAHPDWAEQPIPADVLDSLRD